MKRTSGTVSKILQTATMQMVQICRELRELDDESDNKCEDSKRFHKHDTKDHCALDLSCSFWVTSNGFERSGDEHTDTDRWTKYTE